MDLWLTLVSPVLVSILSCFCGDIWSCLKDKVCSNGKLEENLVFLRNALEDLRERRNLVENQVKAGKLKGEQPRDIVTNWVSQVQAIESNTSRLIADASGQDASSQVVFSNDASAAHPSLSTSGCCLSNCCLAGKVSKKLTEVRNLTRRGNFEVVTEQAPSPVVKRMNVEQTFGLDTTLEKTWASLMLNENRMLGIYGIGGIGKTTLLTQINNKFLDVQDDFDVVLWVKVSKDVDMGRIQGDVGQIQVDIEKIQDTIGERLGLCDGNWWKYSSMKKADEINRVLTVEKNRFALLLDDLWNEVSLTTIGIPFQAGEKKNKVVFTTRSENVCGRMRANQDIKVECLAEEDALELLKLNARCSTLYGGMLENAKKIVNRCGRLPLAIQVIGKCLSTRKTSDEWRDVLNTLDSCPHILEGMEMDVFRVLKVSYDRLQENAKLCFQYCALFPTAYNIRQDKLVEYWICEGILAKKEEREIAKIRGVEIINTLVEASLLLKDETNQKVSMHNMIREAALWIVSNFRDEEIFFVKTDAGLSQLPNVTEWTTVTKMSLMKNEIKSIPNKPDDIEFPNLARLITLFLQNNKLENTVSKLFHVMSTLVVLDLSDNLHITELSEGISKLVALRFLNLSGTSIKYLPNGLAVLTQLIHLNLESTSNLRNIRLISKLLKLQVLRFFDSRASLDLLLLKDLECLGDLEILTITVRENKVLEAFLVSKLSGKTHGLYLEEFKVSGEAFAAIGALGSLHNLEMVKCDIAESRIEWKSNRSGQISPSTSSSKIIPSNTWFKNLSAVKLLSCTDIKDLTWLIYAGKLKSLNVESSPKMEEIISKEKAAGVNVEPFLNLQVLCLDYLDALKSIYWSPLPFSRLHQVRITECLELHKLPFNSTSVEKIEDLRMEVEKEWFERLEWDDEARHRFRPCIFRASAV